MKKTILKSILVAATCFGAVAAQAQTVKIVSFNSGKVLAGYYKAQQYTLKLNVQKMSAEQMIATQQKDLQQLSNDFQAIDAKWRATSATETKTRDALTAEATLKSETFNHTRDALQKTINEEQDNLNKQIQAAQQDAAKDVVGAVKIVATKMNATVVLDVNSVVYIDTSMAKDISDDVLAELNKGHEKELEKPADTKAPDTKPADTKPAASGK